LKVCRIENAKWCETRAKPEGVVIALADRVRFIRMRK